LCLGSWVIPGPSCQKLALKAYGAEWLWGNIQTLGGTEWIAEAMQNRTLILVTDGSYMKHLKRNMSGAELTNEDRATEKRVLGLLAELSASAGSYCAVLLGMLAVRIFLLATESFYVSFIDE
jgi:hypothetical protein